MAVDLTFQEIDSAVKLDLEEAMSFRKQIREVFSFKFLKVFFQPSSKNADKDYLSPFFKKYFPYPPKRILEGGCGIGKYVIAYRKLGYDIVGVDFSGDTIKRIKEEVDEKLPVYEADVTALPFGDGFFDCYYSGGVLEHFEDGPDCLLKEARRILKKGGIRE